MSKRKPIEPAEPGVFMTDDTQKTLQSALVEGLTQGATPGKHILLLGPDDINSHRKLTPALKEQFRAAGIPPSIGDMLERGTNLIGRSGFAISGRRVNFVVWQQDKHNPPAKVMADNTCLVSLPLAEQETDPNPDDHIYYHDQRTPQGFSEFMLDLPPGTLDSERIPGNRLDILLLLGHHESDHCQNADFRFPEYASDTHANKQYATDLAAGRATDPELPYYMRSMRAGSFMLGVPTEHYRLNGLTPLAGEKPLTDKEKFVATQQVEEMRSRVYSAIDHNTSHSMEELKKPENREIQAKLVYEQTRLMTLRGDFNDLYYGKAMAERFVDGAQRYGHGIYGVAQEDRILNKPDMPREAYGLTSPATRPSPLQEIRF